MDFLAVFILRELPARKREGGAKRVEEKNEEREDEERSKRQVITPGGTLCHETVKGYKCDVQREKDGKGRNRTTKG